MPSTGYIPTAMDPLPIPGAAQAQSGEFMPQPEVQPAQPQSLPQGAGFVPKSGAGAYIASQLLNGWMAGRKIKAEREQRNAVQDVQQSKSVYDTIAKSYQDLIRGGGDKNSPEAQKIQQQMTYAWNNYLNSAQKYAIPEEPKGQKKSVGQKVKGAVSKGLQLNTQPHLVAQGAIDMLRQSGPPDLHFAPSPEDRLSQLQLTDAEHKKQMQDDWENLAKKDPKTLTSEERSRMEGLERTLFGKNAVDQKRAQLMDDVLSGKTTNLTGDQRELIGLKQDTTTGFLQDKQGKNWLVAYDSKGSILSKKDTGIDSRVPEDQASAAKRVMETQVRTMAGFFKKIHPDWTPQQIEQAAVEATYPQAKNISDSLKNEQQQQDVNNAVGRVLAASGDDSEKLKNFVTMGPDGQYHYVTDVSNPTSVTGSLWWKKPVFQGGATAAEMPALESKFRDGVVAQLTDQIMAKNKGMPKARAQAIARGMLPPAVYQSSDKLNSMRPPEAMSSPPTSTAPQAMNEPPNSSKMWRATAPDGSVIDDVTDDEMQAMKADSRFKGVTFQRSVEGSGRPFSSSF